ncbi:MAG: hypothetical protein ACPGSD_12015 [Flavobacteriales bacterium]
MNELNYTIFDSKSNEFLVPNFATFVNIDWIICIETSKKIKTNSVRIHLDEIWLNRNENLQRYSDQRYQFIVKRISLKKINHANMFITISRSVIVNKKYAKFFVCIPKKYKIKYNDKIIVERPCNWSIKKTLIKLSGN